MLPSRKADISLNVIIIAVIGIVVLVVLVIMFTGKAKSFGTATTNCEAKGGLCKPACASNEIEHYGTDCGARAADGTVPGNKCCAPFYESPPPAAPSTPAPPPAAPETKSP